MGSRALQGRCLLKNLAFPEAFPNPHPLGLQDGTPRDEALVPQAEDDVVFCTGNIAINAYYIIRGGGGFFGGCSSQELRLVVDGSKGL